MKKYNLELLTFIMFGMVTLCAIFAKDMSFIQKAMLAYMFLFTLHEWEESRIPGGFSKLMAKFFGLAVTPEQEALSHIPVAVLLILITFVPFFTQWEIFALVPIYLGIFEAIVHVVGIRLHKMTKPYTPGMITALILCLTSVVTLHAFSVNGIVHGRQYVWGILLMLVCFVLMQRTVIAIFGLGYKDLIVRVKEKLRARNIQ